MQFSSLGLSFLFLQPLNVEDRSCLKNFHSVYRLETRDGVYLTMIIPSEDEKLITYSYSEVSISTENEWMSLGPRTQVWTLGESFYEPYPTRQEWKAVTCDGENRLIQRNVWRDTQGVRNERYGRPSLIVDYVIWDYHPSENRVSRSTQSEHYYSPHKKEEIKKEESYVLITNSKAFCLKRSARRNRQIPPGIEEKTSEPHACYLGVIDRSDWAEEWRKKKLGPYATYEFPIYLRRPGLGDFDSLTNELFDRFDSQIRHRFK